MNLLELQRAFQAHILAGSGDIAAQIVSSERNAKPTRLAVYADGYTERLIEALRVTYPALERALGPERFGQCVGTLAHAAPSRFFSVRDYGRELAELIERDVPGTRGRVAAELARWEWALAEAFDAADARPLEEKDLEQLDPSQWAELRFALAPSVRTLSLTTNAVRWWQAASQAGVLPRRWRSQRAARWMIWRRELAIYFRQLAIDEARALATLRRGASFSVLCSQLAKRERPEQAAVRAATLLKRWLREGLLTAHEASTPR